jgi:hypothetical protein
MKLLVVPMLYCLFLIGCGQPPQGERVTNGSVDVAPVTVEVTVESKVEVTREVVVTQLVEVTRQVEVPVTVTLTATPVSSPTSTNTPLPTDTPMPTNTPAPTNTALPTNPPSPTPIPSPTPDLPATATLQAFGELGMPKGDGFYQVALSILPGKWRSNGSGDGCYWARLDANQELLNNHFGSAGGTVTILPTDYEVEFNGCGMWEYVENETPVLLSDAADPKENGFFTVGVEIAPGQWRSTGTGDGCYWARLDGNQNILDNHFGNAGGTVTVFPSDYEIQYEGCGVWVYVGP